MLEVSPAQGIGLARVDKLLAGVLTDRLEHRVPRSTRLVQLQHERLVDEVRQKFEDAIAVNALAGANCLGRLEGRSSDKDGQSPKQQTFGRGEEVIAPVDQPTEGLLARDSVSSAAGGGAEPM